MIKAYLIVVALAVTLISLALGCIYGISHLFGQPNFGGTELWVNVIFAVGFPLIIISIGLFVEPAKKEVLKAISSVGDALNANVTRIYIFGESRTGKTTFIGGVVALKPPATQLSTQDRRVYLAKVLLDLTQGKYVDLKIQDYRGERPEDGIYMDEAFAGPVGSPRVNIIFFMVDLFDEELKKGTKTPLTDDEFSSVYGERSWSEMEKRVERNKGYVSPAIMRAIVSRLLNVNKIKAVVLVINKVNLVEAMQQAGHIDKSKSASEISLSQYDATIRALHEICESSGLQGKNKVWILSVKDITDTRSRLFEILG
jgi:hypothetical protein